MPGLVVGVWAKGEKFVIGLVTGKQKRGEKEWTVHLRYLSPGVRVVLCSQSFPGTQKGVGISESKRVGGGLLNHCCFLGAQGSGKVQCCQNANSISSYRVPVDFFLPLIEKLPLFAIQYLFSI